MVNIRSKFDKGMSVIEVLMAVAISSIILVLAYSATTKVFKFMTETETSLTGEVDNYSALRDVSKMLSGSMVMRKGLIDCSGISTAIKTSSSAKFEFLKSSDAAGDFNLVYTEDATLGARDLSATNALYLTNLAGINLNSTVVVIDKKKPTNWGFYNVETFDSSTRRITLKSVTVIDPFKDCVPSSTLDISQVFLNAEEGASIFFVHNVKFVNFKIEKKDVIASIWPFGTTGIIRTQLAFKEFVGISMNFNWTAYDSDGKSGKLTYETALDTTQRTLQGPQTVRVTSSGNYEMMAASVINKAAQTAAAVTNEIFPTCGLVITAVPDSVQPAASSLQGKRLFKLTGDVSEEDATGTISVAMSAVSSGATINCILEDDLSDSSPESVYSSSLEISYTNNAYGVLYCAVDGEILLKSSTSYFDNGLGRNLSVDCSSSTIKAFNLFKYSGSKTSCDEDDATINKGKLVENSGESNPANGPNLSFKCDWDGDGKGWENCDPRPKINGNKLKLQEIRLFPNNLRIWELKNSGQYGNTASDYVDCN